MEGMECSMQDLDEKIVLSLSDKAIFILFVSEKKK